jgi:signal transduction histidine kinase/ActR/RegA family two-component response regulator
MSDLDRAVRGWLETAADRGIMLTDGELVVRGWNQWLQAFSGRRRADVVGRPLFEVWPELVGRGLDQHYRDALAGRVRVVAQALHGYLLQMPKRLTDVPFDWMPQSARVAPLSVDGRVVGTITVIEDASDRIVREADLRGQIESLKIARSAAEDAARVKDEFLATLSHELRTPLSAVLGWTNILTTRQLDVRMLTRGLEVIQRNAASQLRLVEDMLDVSRMISGKLRLDMRELDLVATVMGVVETLLPTAMAKSVTIRSDITPEMPVVNGDPERFSQVVWNLIVNAVKFTPSGGTVTVTLKGTAAAAVLSVADTGQGIDPDFLPHVFEPFRQADGSTTRQHGGLGLGLALVRRISELHGGNVTAESAGYGHGSTFTVTLPVVHVAREVWRPPVPSQDAASMFKGIKALVVDDSPEARELLTIELEALGLTVGTAASSREALEILVSCTPEHRPDILVADIGMPDADGHAFIQAVRALDAEHGGGTPAVAITGYARPEERAKALSAGFHRYFVKPLDISLFVETLEEILTDRRARPV